MSGVIDPGSLSVLLVSKLGNAYRSRHPEIRFDCPFCTSHGNTPDTKGRLWINVDKQLFLCYRCKTRGNLDRLFVLLGLGAAPVLTDWNRILELLLETADVIPEDDDSDAPCEYPCDVIPALENSLASRYLLAPKGEIVWKSGKGRGLTHQQIIDYGIVVGAETPFKTRIFIPTYNNAGVVVYWVARDMTGEAKAKYINPERSRRSQIFNLHRAINYQYCIITEGVFSAIAAGDNAVATYGKMISSAQVYKLADAGFSRYYVALDNDAMEESIDLCRSLDSLGKEVWFVPLPTGQDPDSVSDFTECLRSSRKFTIAEAIRHALDGFSA